MCLQKMAAYAQVIALVLAIDIAQGRYYALLEVEAERAPPHFVDERRQRE